MSVMQANGISLFGMIQPCMIRNLELPVRGDVRLDMREEEQGVVRNDVVQGNILGELQHDKSGDLESVNLLESIDGIVIQQNCEVPESPSLLKQFIHFWGTPPGVAIIHVLASIMFLLTFFIMMYGM